MYPYNDPNAYPSTASNAQTVPNVMFDAGGEKFGAIEVQEGANYSISGTADGKGVPAGVDLGGTHTVPVYAIDTSIQQFEIPDPIVRRAFARKVFIILLLQNIIVLGMVEIFMMCIDEPISPVALHGLHGLMLCIYLAFYFFPDIRRYAPMNIVAFVIITLLMATQEGMMATWLQSQLAIFPQLILIIQLLALIGYAAQTRYKFNNINALLLILLISIAGHYLVQIVYPMFSSLELAYTLVSMTTYRAFYIVYDMQLQLSGHHGYNLQASEHFFCATNIYVDFPNLCWRLFKFVIIKPIIRIYQFFKGCCFAEVC